MVVIPAEPFAPSQHGRQLFLMSTSFEVHGMRHVSSTCVIHAIEVDSQYGHLSLLIKWQVDRLKFSELSYLLYW